MAPSHLLILQGDPRSRALLKDALEDHFLLLPVRSWREMERQAARVKPLACVLDVFGFDPSLSLSTLRRFRRRYPLVALVICSDFSGREMELYHLGRANVDGVVRLEESPTPRRVRAVVEEALSASLAQAVVRSTIPEYPSLAQEALRWAIEQATAKPQVSDFAKVLGVSPRALLRELRILGLVPPRTLLLWGRLILATHLLQRPHWTVERVALTLGYATGGALRKALKRHVGCSPTTLLKRGGLTLTLEAFRREGLGRGQRGRERWAHTGSSQWTRSHRLRRPP